MNNLQNKYTFSFLGCVGVLSIATVLTKVVIYLLGLSYVTSEGEGFGRLILLTYIWPLFFIVGLTIYFIISKKIFKSVKDAFLLLIDLFVWLIFMIIALYFYTSIRQLL